MFRLFDRGWGLSYGVSVCDAMNGANGAVLGTSSCPEIAPSVLRLELASSDSSMTNGSLTFRPNRQTGGPVRGRPPACQRGPRPRPDDGSCVAVRRLAHQRRRILLGSDGDCVRRH